jgi:hypothetical protein
MGANLSKALGASLPFSLDNIPMESHLGFVTASGRLFGNKEMRLLMLGLDAAGKTSKEPLLRPSSLFVPWMMLIVTRQRSYTS